MRWLAMNRLCGTFSRCLLVLIALTTTASYGQITFNDFSDVSSLALNGSATQATNDGGQKVLRLSLDGNTHVSGSAWFQTQQQSVSRGFTSVFHFQITHSVSFGLNPADGIAFLIQNSSGEGFGTQARGGAGGSIGYGPGDDEDPGTAIPNSLAVEFDTYQNDFDPNANHIAVQSCGTLPNSPDHNGPCALGIVTDLGGMTLADGFEHTAVIEYDPPAGDATGILRVFIDNFGTPILTVNVDLSSLLSLSEDDTAWVGFTGATGSLTENNDILSWTFTPGTTETTITQTLTPDQEDAVTNYVFGSYNHKLQYSGANADQVTVTAIPISQEDFAPRLADTPYSNDQCVIYEGTGGLCVEFRVTCTDNVGTDCTDLPYDLFNNFNTQDTITGPCLLKAPIDTNDWTNIIESFVQTRNDPGSKGNTKGFSDFILAQGKNGQPCTAPPAITITSPANNSLWPVGSVPIQFACAPDPTAPSVTTTSCTGNVVGPGVNQSVNSGDSVTFTGTGAASLTVSATDSVLNSSSATSNFTLGVPPAITSAASTTFSVGVPGSFTVTATGSPIPSLSESGALPSGVTFTDNHNGTATLAGTPSVSGTFPIAFTASNGVGSNAVQNFTLTVSGPMVTVSPSSIDFGTVYRYSLLSRNVTITNTGTSKLSISKISIVDGTADWDDYTLLNFCGSSLSPGKSCKVTVVFWADDLGTRTATLNIADNAPGSPQQVSLTANVIKKK